MLDDPAAGRSLRPGGRRRLWRWACRLGAVGGLTVLALVACAVLWIRSEAASHVFVAADVPTAPVALVLGAQVDPDGVPSPFLAARLDLARQLFDTGKVRAVLVSGDHGRWSYDEPGAMRGWLIDHGVPADRVVEDHAGFDTYDSCVRAHRIFGVDRAIVVTQSFHVARAVALCREVGVDAAGVGDDSVRRFRDTWLRNDVREQFAAVKAVADVVSRRDPVFLGPRETGVDDALRG